MSNSFQFKSNKNKAAISMLELIVTMVILSILFVAGTPVFLNMYRDGVIHDSSIEFVKDLHANKQTAINESTSIYMYPANESDDFSGGWHNYNNGNIIARDIDATVTITSSIASFGLKFSSEGKLYDAVTEFPVVEQTYTFCHAIDSAIQGRMITVNSLGRTTIEYVEC
jgi:Tfp pilus assembly protein FimT